MHTIRHKEKLIARIRKVKGQLAAVERALIEEQGCETVIRTIAAARGAINALAAEVLCGHVTEHLVAPRISNDKRANEGAVFARVLRQFVG